MWHLYRFGKMLNNKTIDNFVNCRCNNGDNCKCSSFTLKSVSGSAYTIPGKYKELYNDYSGRRVYLK